MGDHFDKENNEIECDVELDLQILREDLAAELLAINQYQEHIESLADMNAIKTLEDIRDSKKEYVGELFQLIQRLDNSKAKKLKRGHNKNGT